MVWRRTFFKSDFWKGEKSSGIEGAAAPRNGRDNSRFSLATQSTMRPPPFARPSIGPKASLINALSTALAAAQRRAHMSSVKGPRHGRKPIRRSLAEPSRDRAASAFSRDAVLRAVPGFVLQRLDGDRRRHHRIHQAARRRRHHLAEPFRQSHPRLLGDARRLPGGADFFSDFAGFSHPLAQRRFRLARVLRLTPHTDLDARSSDPGDLVFLPHDPRAYPRQRKPSLLIAPKTKARALSSAGFAQRESSPALTRA